MRTRFNVDYRLPLNKLNLPLVQSGHTQQNRGYTLDHVIGRVLFLFYSRRLKRLGRFAAFFIFLHNPLTIC